MADGDSELKVVILTAAPDSEDETKLRPALLSGVSGPQATHGIPPPAPNR